MRSDLAAAYGQERLPRYTSYPTAPHFSAAVEPGAYADWLKAIAAGRFATVKGYALSDDDRLRADIIERIMCDYGVDLDAICTRHGARPDEMLRSAPRLQALISDGVVELDGASLAVREGSRFLVRSVAAAFDAHLDAAQRLHRRAV